MSSGYRVDLHVKVLDDVVVERARAAGFDALVYAPHFERLPDVREEAARYADDDLLVVPARELFTGTWRTRKHVLAIGLAEPVPDFLTLEGTLEELERQSAAVLVPHPGFLNVSLTGDDVSRFDESIHAVEVFNPKHLAYHNRRAEALAASLDLPPFASSYAHLRGSVGEAWTTFDRRIRSGDDLARALKAGEARRVGRGQGVRHRLQCGAERAHLLYENSWGKFDRLVLSGTAATHPRHPAYGGRFDDVAVY